MVLTTGDMLLLERVKDALDDAGIPYVVHGAGEHGIMALGMWNASGFAIPHEIIVLMEDRERALRVINEIREGRPLD